MSEFTTKTEDCPHRVTTLVRIKLQRFSFRFKKPPANTIWSVRGAVTDSLRYFQL